METTVTALEMRKKFGGILDRVIQNGEHVTIMRGNRPLATLIPAEEHSRQCTTQGKLRSLDEALNDLESWKKRNPDKVRKMSKTNSTTLLRQARNSR